MKIVTLDIKELYVNLPIEQALYMLHTILKQIISNTTSNYSNQKKGWLRAPPYPVQ